MIQETPTVQTALKHICSYRYREHALTVGEYPPAQWADPYEERFFFGLVGYEHAANEEAITLLSNIATPSNPAQDVALFYLAMALKRAGDAQSASRVFFEAFNRGRRLLPALLEGALLLQELNERESAIHVLKQFIEHVGDQAAVRACLNLRELDVYLEARSSTSTRIARLIQPCAFLGASSGRLTSKQSKILDSILDAAREAHEKGTLGKPELAGKWPLNRPKPLRVMLIFARHLHCSENFGENDVLRHLESSAIARGHTVEVFQADRLLYGTDALPVAERIINGEIFHPDAARTSFELGRLARAISDFSPDIVLFEANFIPTETTLTPQWFGALPERRNFALLAVVQDQNERLPDFAGAWTAESDFVIGFDEKGSHAEKLRQSGKFLYFPTVPCMPNPHARDPKEHDFVFLGSMTRGRDAVLCRVARDVPGHLIIASDRKVDSSPPTLAAYYRTLASGKSTFNTGYSGKGISPIRTGRVQEAILSRTALLEESHAEVARTLIPHVHFLPVDNAAQVVCWTQYLAENPKQWEQLVDAAFDFTEGNYSAGHFWSMVESATAGISIRHGALAAYGTA